MPHSILGSLDEYLQEAAAHGHVVELPPVIEDSDLPSADLYIKLEFQAKPKNLENDNGENALSNWRKKMLERKTVQTNVSSKKKLAV
jgi:hypothetical protein